MRLGVLADVHANHLALEAVLALLERERVDAYACAGDLVGYGVEPSACVLRVAGLPGACVAGNHDLLVTGRLSPERHLPPLAAGSLAWTTRHLDPRARAVLERLPLIDAVDGVLVAHGAPGDPERYVRTPADAHDVLAARPRAATVVLGHTHEPLAVGSRRGVLLRGTTGRVALAPGERHVLNPGSVGQARERVPLARAMVLDLDRGEAVFHATAYDAAACRRALRRAGRPAWSCHLSPALAARVRRRLAPAPA